jgi:hypothetical protein
VTNVNNDPYKQQIEQSTKELRTALEGGITKRKGPVLRNDPRRFPRLTYDVMRKISEYNWQIDEEFMQALLEETIKEDDRVILSPKFKKLFPGLQKLEVPIRDEYDENRNDEVIIGSGEYESIVKRFKMFGVDPSIFMFHENISGLSSDHRTGSMIYINKNGRVHIYFEGTSTSYVVIQVSRLEDGPRSKKILGSFWH